MASNKLNTMLTRFKQKIFSVLAHSFLEWVLIVFLFSNSIFALIIRKFAFYFNLKQPCILCTRVDHLINPTQNTTYTYKSLVCENHASELSTLGYCSNHQRMAKSQQMCEECFTSNSKKHCLNQTESNEETHSCSCCEKVLSKKLQSPVRGSLLIQEIGEEICGKIGCNVTDVCNHSGSEHEPQILSDVGSVYIRETAEENSNEEDDLDDHKAEGKNSVLESSLHKSLVDKMEGDDGFFLKTKQLKSDFVAEQKAQNELYAELEAERNAAAIAANQTMAMITRLQEEKAAMQMEALHYQRVMEEQAEYDQEALRLLNELVAKREREKEDVEKELEVYREKVSDYETEHKAIQKCIENTNLSSSCSIDNDSDVLSIDLNRHYNKVEDSEFSPMECSKEWGAIKDSLEELEEERMSIIKQLNDLEEKLQETEKQEKTQMGEEEQEKNEVEPNSDICNQEVNLVSSCFSMNIASGSNPKSMASVARRLLDLVESDDDGGVTEDVGTNNEVQEGTTTATNTELGIAQLETDRKTLAVKKEMDHVYGRLQALEADTEFLRHCIGSVNKGNEGVTMLQEILEHLRVLRDAEICF